METIPTESEPRGKREGPPKFKPFRKPLGVTAVSVLGIFILLFFYTLYFARAFFLPVVLAWILSYLLKPLMRSLNRLHIPSAVGAGLVLLSLLAVVGSGVLFLSGPASNWIDRVPESFEKVEDRIRGMMTSASKLSEAAASVEQLAGAQDSTPKVELKKPGLLNSVWDQAKGFVFLALEVFVLLYFFLAAGDVFAVKLVQMLPRLEEKKNAVEIMRQTENAISQFLVSMTMVNLVEGTIIGVGLALLGMPNPLLWGVLACLANYIPYLGPLVAGIVISIAALVSFDSVSRALMAPVIYFGVNFTDNFVSPYVMGRRLVLNPVIVFIAVMFWGWIWGIAGVLLAVPITMTAKIICDHVPAFAPFSEFLTAGQTERGAADGAVTQHGKGNA